MRLAVLGAAGAMGRVVIRDLLALEPEVEITAADARPVAAAGGRLRAATLDVRDEAATAALVAGHDAVLNCVNYYWNVPVMRAALAARVPYADLGGLYHGTLRQLELDEAFRQAGVPALLGMGSTPGITNAMAGALARQVDAVEEVHVRVGCLDRTASGPLPVPYALDTLLDEVTLEPWVVEDGVAHAVPPLSGGEEVDFPPPVGRMTAISTLHSEVAMFPRSFPSLRAASFKVAFEPALVERLRFLVELGFASRQPLLGDVAPRAMLQALAARQPAPPDAEPADCDALLVDLVGRRGGERVRLRGSCVVLPHPEWHVAAGALDTASPLAIAGTMLARREIATPGVLFPEVALPFDRFFAELLRRGIRVDAVPGSPASSVLRGVPGS